MGITTPEQIMSIAQLLCVFIVMETSVYWRHFFTSRVLNSTLCDRKWLSMTVPL